jgi:hypothetical protein
MGLDDGMGDRQLSRAKVDGTDWATLAVVQFSSETPVLLTLVTVGIYQAVAGGTHWGRHPGQRSTADKMLEENFRDV